MEKDTTLPSGEVVDNSTGDVTLQPPFILHPWKPPSKFERSVERGISLTIRLTPTAIMFWIFAPDEVKYLIKSYSRYIPWAVRYMVWWLNQNA